MSSFILCYRPRRPVLTVVSCFCLMSSICFLSVFMLSSLLSCVFHSVISCFVSPVCCCPHQVELIFLFRPRHVSVSVLSFHLSVLSPSSVALLLSSVVLCCPPVVPSPPSLSHHVSSIISSLSCPLSWSVSSRVFPPVMFCLVLSCLSPVSLLSVLLPSCDCVRETLQSGGSSSTTKHILALESKLTY